MKAISIRTQPGFRLWIRFEDGTEGTADLACLKGRGVFALWNEPGAFEEARIGTSGEIVWADSVDLCPDALYLRISGRSPADFLHPAKAPTAHA